MGEMTMHPEYPLGVRKTVKSSTRSDCCALIVEDDPASRETLATFLRRRGYEVKCASTVAAGRAMLTANVTHVILDLRLPDGTGLRLLERAKEKGLPAKVAVVTGLNKGDVLADAVMMQPDAFLTKPVDFCDVIAWLEGTRPSLHEYLGVEGSEGTSRWGS